MSTDKFAIPLSIVIAGAIIGGALYLSNTQSTNKNAQAQNTQGTTQTSDIRKVTSDDHILGDPNAKLLIVEYSDTECPFCKQFHVTMHQLVAEYGKDSRVAWVYRHFPIDQLHPKSRKEAEATECANELGGPTKFWEFINMVYENTPSNNQLDPLQLPKFAKAIGLDEQAFNTCLASGKYAAKVEADYQDAVKGGGRGTPFSVIISKDGTKTPVSGAYPYADFKAIVDGLLK